jgi:hypothetical protein
MRQTAGWGWQPVENAQLGGGLHESISQGLNEFDELLARDDLRAVFFSSKSSTRHRLDYPLEYGR